MELVGERALAAARERVWEALNDAGTLKACLRGCEKLEKTSDSTFAATITTKVGPIKATFAGSVVLSDLEPPAAYTIAFEGKGGAAGFAKGKARVRLDTDAGGTLLRYSVDASLGGKLGQMGSRVVDGVAREMADDFFGRFAEIVVPPSAPEGARPPDATGAAVPAGVAPQPPAARRPWVRALVAAAVLAVLALVVYRLLS